MLPFLFAPEVVGAGWEKTWAYFCGLIVLATRRIYPLTKSPSAGGKFGETPLTKP